MHRSVKAKQVKESAADARSQAKPMENGDDEEGESEDEAAADGDGEADYERRPRGVDKV